MKINAAQVKKLRETTLAPIMDCKVALLETKGDLKKAKELLRKKGLAHARGLVGKATKEGLIYSYIHAGGKIGVLLEINSQTDFVARTDEFKNLARDIAMQVAAMNPSYIVRKELPEEVIRKEKEIYREGAKGKPKGVIDKIVEGKLEKFYREVCLLEQSFIKDEKITVKEYLDSIIAKFKENIVVRRFVRYRLGEEL
ncbi:elongation factor Ts [bacterium]|nr:elongation factor Ts [bacterium]